MILCCGEALIDMLPRQLPGGEPVFLPVAGGAVFNTAIALGRLGEKTGFFCGISTDLMGEILISGLEQSGVDHSLCPRSSLPTTLAFVKLTNGHAEYAFYDEMTAGRMITDADLPDPPEVAAAHFGAISLIPEPCGSTFEELAVSLKERAVISLDPNIRSGFVDREAIYRARLDRMLGIADIVKVSDEDLAWLRPGLAFEEIAAGWIAKGASLVILTRGERGAIAMTRSGRFEAAAVPASVVDTVGAGDTFNAGLLAGLKRAGVLSRPALRQLQEAQLRPALDLAAKAAAITVSRAGANPPWASEIA